MKIILLILLSCWFTIAHAEADVIGEVEVEKKVVFHTTKYHMDGCDSPGFHVVQRQDNDKLSFYCGTEFKRGDTYITVIELGI